MRKIMPTFYPKLNTDYKLSIMTQVKLFVFLAAAFYMTNAAGKNLKSKVILLPKDITSGESFGQPGQPTIHIVAGKETLFSISKKYGVTVEEIKRRNNLKSNSISIGQSLTIGKKSAAAAEPEKPPALSAADLPSPSPQKTLHARHTVAPKETLFSIAKKYGITVENLKEWNNIGSEGLKAGSAVWIMPPAYSSSAAAPDKTEVTEQPVSRAKEKENKEVTNADKPLKEAATALKEPATALKEPAKPPAKPELQTVDTSKSVTEDSDEVKESGNIALMEGADKNKYLCWHRNATVGSILKVKNLATGKEVFVRVQGRLDTNDTQYILRISSLAAQRLGEVSTSFKGDVTYYK